MLVAGWEVVSSQVLPKCLVWLRWQCVNVQINYWYWQPQTTQTTQRSCIRTLYDRQWTIRTLQTVSIMASNLRDRSVVNYRLLNAGEHVPRQRHLLRASRVVLPDSYNIERIIFRRNDENGVSIKIVIKSVFFSAFCIFFTQNRGWLVENCRKHYNFQPFSKTGSTKLLYTIYADCKYQASCKRSD